MSDQTFPLDTMAKLLDLTPQRVLQLVKMGVIPKKERGRYELVPVVRGYIKYLRERGIRSDVSGDDYNTHRTRLTKVKADIAEMEKAQIEEQLIPAGDVERAWMDVSQAMRQKLLSFPQRVAPEVYAVEKLPQVKQILQSAIYEALNEIANVEVKTINPVRASGGGEDQPGSAGGDEAPAEPKR